jgi:hypothetical protein
MIGLWLSFRSKKRDRNIVSRQMQAASIAKHGNDPELAINDMLCIGIPF